MKKTAIKYTVQERIDLFKCLHQGLSTAQTARVLNMEYDNNRTANAVKAQKSVIDNPDCPSYDDYGQSKMELIAAAAIGGYLSFPENESESSLLEVEYEDYTMDQVRNATLDIMRTPENGDMVEWVWEDIEVRVFAASNDPLLGGYYPWENPLFVQDVTSELFKFTGLVRNRG